MNEIKNDIGYWGVRVIRISQVCFFISLVVENYSESGLTTKGSLVTFISISQWVLYAFYIFPISGSFDLFFDFDSTHKPYQLKELILFFFFSPISGNYNPFSLFYPSQNLGYSLMLLINFSVFLYYCSHLEMLQVPVYFLKRSRKSCTHSYISLVNYIVFNSNSD